MQRLIPWFFVVGSLLLPVGVRAEAALDVDSNGATEALEDGLIVLRHLFGFSGTSLTTGALSVDADRIDPQLIADHVAAQGMAFDIDGNGQLQALEDGLMVLRYLFGFSGESLTANVVGAGATRTTPEAILDHLRTLEAAGAFNLRGRVVKGSVEGARVRLYAVVNGERAAEPLAVIESDDDGGYVLAVPADAVGPFVVEVDNPGGARMRCDVPGGCNETPFGSFFAVDASFLLRAVLPAAEEGTSATVSAFSELAASTLLDADDAPPITAESAAAANDNVAQIFDLDAIIDLQLPDASQADDLAAADADGQRAALLSAALLGELLATGDLEAGLSDLTTAFVDADGAFIENDGEASGVSLADLFEAAGEIAEDPSVSLDDDSVGRDLRNDGQFAAASPPGTLRDSEPSPHAGLADLDKAKAFVTDMRTTVRALQDSRLGGDVLRERLDAVRTMFGDEAGDVFDGLARAVEAMAAAVDDYEESGETTAFVFDGLTVHRTEAENGLSLAIDDTTATGITIALDAGDVNLEDTETETQSGFDLSGNLAGTVSSQNIELDVERGDFAVVDAVEVVETEQGEGGVSVEHGQVDLAQLTLDLAVTMTQTAAASSNPLTFAGSIYLDVHELSKESRRTTSHDCPDVVPDDSDDVCTVEEDASTLVFDSLSLELGGSIHDLIGIASRVGLAFDARGNGATFSDLSTFILGQGQFNFFLDYTSESMFEETDDEFIEAGLSLLVATPVATLGDDFLATLSVRRDAREGGHVRAGISYGGRRFDAELARLPENVPERTTLIIENQDDVILAGTVDEEEKTLTGGTLELGGVKHGDVEDRPIGFVVVFTDETFQSLQ